MFTITTGVVLGLLIFRFGVPLLFNKGFWKFLGWVALVSVIIIFLVVQNGYQREQTYKQQAAINSSFNTNNLSANGNLPCLALDGNCSEIKPKIILNNDMMPSAITLPMQATTSY